MRFSTLSSLLLAGVGLASAASSWNFDEAVISVASKGAGVGNALKDKLSDHAPLSKPVPFGATDSLKIVLTATEDGKPKRPHQAFLLLRDQDTGLEATFPFSMKDSGKGKVDFTQNDLPVQLQISSQPLRATLLIASFGKSTAFSNHVFNLDVKRDANAPPVKYEKPERYGQKPTINHIFKADPQSPPKIVSLVFVLAVVATVPVLLGAWLYLGANVSQLQKAFSTAPGAHILFFGSIISMEILFFLYYWKLTLFELLPRAGVVGIVGYVSGSKALSEVQLRRLSGDR